MVNITKDVCLHNVLDIKIKKKSIHHTVRIKYLFINYFTSIPFNFYHAHKKMMICWNLTKCNKKKYFFVCVCLLLILFYGMLLYIASTQKILHQKQITNHSSI